MHNPTPWTFEKILMALIRSWGFPFGLFCPMFLEEALKLSDNSMSLYAQAGFSFVQSSHSYMIFSTGLCIHTTALVCQIYCGIIVPWLPV